MLERNDMILRDERMGALSAYAPQRPPIGPEVQEQSIVKAVLAHLRLVIVMLVLAVVGAFVYLSKAEKLYTSTSKIYIDLPAQGVQDLATSQRGSFLFTQCELMRSSPILGPVIERPDVKGLTEFWQERNPLSYLRGHLETEVGRKDDIVSVAVSTTNPEESAILANAVVETFISYSGETQNDAAVKRLNTVKAQREKSMSELSEKQNTLLAFQQSTPELSFQMPNGDSPVIQRLYQMSGALNQAKLNTLQSRATYAAGHPQIKKLLEVEEMYYQQFQEAQAAAMRLNSKNAQYVKIQSEIQQMKGYVDQMDTRIRELHLQVDMIRIPNIRILEPALPIYKASSPKKVQTLALALAIGLLLGVVMAMLRDKMDTRLRSIDEIQAIVGLTILGVVPRMPGRRTAVARAMAVHLDPRSEVSEAYRTIRTAVYFGSHGGRAKTLLVTSPEPGDGKTTSASNIAIAIAQTGRNILLLDADFRKPTQHKNLDVKDTVGLSSVLAGMETLDRAIQRTGVEGLDILPCGPIPENPSEILNSQEFGELIDRLALKYDHILFDSPPVNLVTDARILGAVCDATILVLRAEKSTRKGAEHARNALLSVGAKLLGAVLNDVPRGRGYEVYGGSYYGVPEMRQRTNEYASPGAERLQRLPRPSAEVSE
ncbi:MAG: polysaccharide biosynthesis tyrosine autokinase [Tepidisphaeraceae bacterium]